MGIVWSSSTFGPGAKFAIDDLGVGSILLNEDPLWMAVRSATALSTNQKLFRGEYKPSPSGNFKIGLQEIGELVIRDNKSNTVTWSSGVPDGDEVMMQDDGNLVVRNSALTAIWASATGGQAGARLTVDDAGVGAIIQGTTEIWVTIGADQQNNIVPETKPVVNPNALSFEENLVLDPLQSFPKGKFISSPAGNYKVGLNNAGNLLFQDSNDNIIWHANILGGVEALMQHDGNFVVRDSARNLIWTTHTSDNNGAHLIIDDGGRLAVVAGQTVIWMEGVPRGTYTGPSSPDLQYPLRGIFYYPWYPGMLTTFVLTDRLH
jgi:hypothetical protein